MLLCLASCAHHQATATRAEALASQFLVESGVSGIAVSIGINGSIVWSEGFGYADIEQRVPVLPGLTRFRVGSTAKSMTVMALGRLYDTAKIDLDAPIQRYLPDYPEREGVITARLLAGHLAGIRHYKDDEYYSNSPYSSVREALTIFENDQLLAAPGTEYHYSTYGFNLLSAAIEAAAEQDFLGVMSEYVFVPIGMDRTVADKVFPIISNRSRYYEFQQGELVNTPWVDNSNKWAGGGFLSTSEDLVRFGLAHLSGELLRKETLEMIWTSQSTISGEETGYGLGWVIETDKNGRKTVSHGGISVGGSTMLRIYPDTGLVIAVISNTSGVELTDLTDQFAELF